MDEVFSGSKGYERIENKTRTRRPGTRRGNGKIGTGYQTKRMC
jgi:hypothetical protein